MCVMWRAIETMGIKEKRHMHRQNERPERGREGEDPFRKRAYKDQHKLTLLSIKREWNRDRAQATELMHSKKVKVNASVSRAQKRTKSIDIHLTSGIPFARCVYNIVVCKPDKLTLERVFGAKWNRRQGTRSQRIRKSSSIVAVTSTNSKCAQTRAKFNKKNK